MTYDRAKRSLPEIIDEAAAIASDSQTTFGHLRANQVNWKPSPDQWSVAQCFDHLITTNRGYFPQFDQVIKGEKITTLWQRAPFLPGFFGGLLIRAVSPEAKRKLKAPIKFQPSTSDIDPQIVNKFLAHQQEVIGKVEAMGQKNIDRIVIYSPATNLVIYSALDACRIIVAHERRHLIQAQRVMESRDFPKQ
jgi:hypothetical protein